jgi:hypothetical protein
MGRGRAEHGRVARAKSIILKLMMYFIAALFIPRWLNVFSIRPAEVRRLKLLTACVGAIYAVTLFYLALI